VRYAERRSSGVGAAYDAYSEAAASRIEVALRDHGDVRDGLCDEGDRREARALQWCPGEASGDEGVSSSPVSAAETCWSYRALSSRRWCRSSSVVVHVVVEVVAVVVVLTHLRRRGRHRHPQLPLSPRGQHLHLPDPAELRPVRGDARDQRRHARAPFRPQHAGLGSLGHHRHRVPGGAGLRGRGFRRPLSPTAVRVRVVTAAVTRTRRQEVV
jgi:hypothetical protein